MLNPAIVFDSLWNLVAGPADLGAVDFQNLKRPSSPNHFLVCPEGCCTNALPDRTAQVFRCSQARLMELSQEVWNDLSGVELVASDRSNFEDRYVHRSRVLRFPDTICVRFIALGDESSTLAIYSRSQIGYSDLGANRKRVLHWLSLLQEQLDK